MAYTPKTEDVARAYVKTEIQSLVERGKFRVSDIGILNAEFAAWLARERQEAIQPYIDALKTIRRGGDTWEVDGDDEKFVNEVIDPILIQFLG